LGPLAEPVRFDFENPLRLFMPKAYMVFSYHTPPDLQKLTAYGKLAIPPFEPFGARLLARGNAAAAYERGLKERILIIEFPSLDRAIAAHESPDYQKALAALGDGAVRDVRIVEGVE
jgi:uncharacterized protein (DUF1330 family)